MRCNSIEEVRENIDRIDTEIIKLIAERGKYVIQASSFKKDHEAVKGTKRVEAVIQKVRRQAKEYGANEDMIESLYRDMISKFINMELDAFDAGEIKSILEEQRQLILSGVMYNDLTKDLVDAREKTVFLTDEYNRSFGKGSAEREEILGRLLKSVGEGVHFEPTFRCEFGYNISIGDNFYANFDCVMLDGGGIEIGDNVLFGPRVGIYTSNHAIDAQERVAGACYAKKVRIGNNVWIGGGVSVNQGVTIGDNAIIGSGSVITKSIPANVIAAGVPCKVIREITEGDKTSFMP